MSIFFLINLALTVFYLDTWFNPNPVSRALTVRSLVQDESFRIDELAHLTQDKSEVDKHFYSEKAPLPAIVTAPVYSVLFWLSGEEKSENQVRLALFAGALFCSAIPYVLFLTFLFSKLLSVLSVPKATLYATLPVYGSFVWIFAGTFFSHVFSGVLLVFALYFLESRKSYFLAGIFSGLAFLSEFPIAVVVGLWGLFILYKTKSMHSFVEFSSGVLPSLIFLFIYNFSLTGSPFVMLYDRVESMESWSRFGLGLPNPKVAWELIFSQYRGLIFYMPVLAFFLFILIRESAFFKSAFYNNYLIIPCLAYFLVFSSYHDWWGGWSYGPRQLLPVAILLLFSGIQFIARRKHPVWLFVAFCIPGLMCAVMAKSTILYNLPTKFMYPIFEVVIPKFLKGEFNYCNLLTYIFDFPTSIANMIWIAIFGFLVFICMLNIRSGKLRTL